MNTEIVRAAAMVLSSAILGGCLIASFHNEPQEQWVHMVGISPISVLNPRTGEVRTAKDGRLMTLPFSGAAQ